jgi:hypothetical protein
VQNKIVSIGLMVQSSIPAPTSIVNKRLITYVEKLRRFLKISDWDKVRDNLRGLASHTKKDEMRGSWRFNFGWTEMRVGKAKGFAGIPLDEDGMAFPRVAHIQHVGGEKAAFVLLTFTQLLNIVFDYFDDGDCLDKQYVGNLTKEIQLQLAPLQFPLQVVGTNLSDYLKLGAPSVVKACSCMSRLSVMMFDSQKEQEKEDKFSGVERVFLHVDKNDLESIQFVVAICYKIQEEAFVTVSIREKEENTTFFYWTSLGEDQDLKLFIYGCNFASVVHGNAVFDKDWAKGAPKDAWMIRLTPYGTTHCKGWSEKLRKMSEMKRIEMLSSFHLMGGSKVLGKGALKREELPRVD